MSEIARGLCQCGCGSKTPLATRNDDRHAAIKGQPTRFLRGHQRRRLGLIDHVGGYRLASAPGHARATHGRILEHVAIVESVLGRALPDGAVIHHVNEIKGDNRNANLAVLQGQREHVELHARLRVLRAGGNPWTQRLCCYCHHPKAFDDFYRHLKDREYSSACKDCSRSRCRDRQRCKRSEAA